jgi:hypothetical protein
VYEDYDLYFYDATLEKTKLSIDQISMGKLKTINTNDEIEDLIGI